MMCRLPCLQDYGTMKYGGRVTVTTLQDRESPFISLLCFPAPLIMNSHPPITVFRQSLYTKHGLSMYLTRRQMLNIKGQISMAKGYHIQW